MKVKDYSYETFPRYTKDIEGALELKGNKENLRCRLRDVYYQDHCLIRFLFPNTILVGIWNTKFFIVPSIYNKWHSFYLFACKSYTRFFGPLINTFTN